MTPNVIDGLDLRNFRRGAVFESLIVKASREGFYAGIYATKNEIL
jgi:hypothetical protein